MRWAAIEAYRTEMVKKIQIDFNFRMYVFLNMFILFCMHICTVQRFDLHCSSMRYIKMDVIINIIIGDETKTYRHNRRELRRASLP